MAFLFCRVEVQLKITIPQYVDSNNSWQSKNQVFLIEINSVCIFTVISNKFDHTSQLFKDKLTPKALFFDMQKFEYSESVFNTLYIEIKRKC